MLYCNITLLTFYYAVSQGFLNKAHTTSQFDNEGLTKGGQKEPHGETRNADVPVFIFTAQLDGNQVLFKTPMENMDVMWDQ